MKRAVKRKIEDRCIETVAGKISFAMVRSSRKRHLTISIGEEARVRVTVPFRTTLKETDTFVRERAGWILKHLARACANKARIERKKYRDSHQFPFLGKNCTLNVIKDDIKRAKIDFEDNHWNVTVPRNLEENQQENLIREKLIQWYRQQAEEVLGARLFNFARQMNLTPRKVAIRTQKRMWGCCDYRKQAIHLNWQIVLTPIRVIDYIIIHELCHLNIPNHSKRFWAKVQKFMPDYKEYKQWLKDNQPDLILP